MAKIKPKPIFKVQDKAVPIALTRYVPPFVPHSRVYLTTLSPLKVSISV